MTNCRPGCAGTSSPNQTRNSRPRPDAQADSASAEDIAAAFGDSAASTPTPGPAEETPPWGTDAGADVNLPAAKELKGLTGQLPWLTDIVSAQDTPDAPSDDEPDSEVLDWLAAEEPAADEPGTTPGLLTGLSGDLPWLDEAGLQDASSGAQAESGAGGDPFGNLAGEDLDWLTAGAPAEQPSASEPPPAAPSIRRLQPDAPAETPASGPAASEAATPDWLASSSAEPQAEPVPDWMAAADEFLTEDEAAPAENLPDWLAQAEPPATPQAPEAAAEPSTPVPDWLAQAEGLSGEETAATPSAPPEPGTTGGTPEWLALAEAEFASAESEAEPEPEAPTAQPEWLQGDQDELPPAAPPEDSGVSYDAWMAEQTEKERELTQEEQLAEEVPDWFGDIPAEDAAPEGESAAAATPGSSEPEFVPDWYLGLEEQDASAAPDWFDQSMLSADMLTSAPELPTAPPEPEPATGDPAGTPPQTPPTPESASDVPDWFAEIEGAPAAARRKRRDRPDTGDLPDWFADLQPEEPISPASDDSLDLDALFAAEAPAAGKPSAPAQPGPADEIDFETLMGETPEAALASDSSPDWIADFDAPAPSAAPPDLEPGDAPDWLNAIAPGDMAAAEERAAEDSIAAGDADFMRVIEQELGDYDALEGLDLGPGAAMITDADARFDFESLLADQASDLPAAEVDAAPEASAEPPLTDGARELPEWLLDAQPSPGGGIGFSAVSLALRQPEAPLEELSDRLRALRERSAEVAQIESAPTAGPALSSHDVLADLPGALAPTDLLTSGGSPEVALDLTVSDAQQARVRRLESMLGLDVVPAAPGPGRGRAADPGRPGQGDRAHPRDGPPGTRPQPPQAGSFPGQLDFAGGAGHSLLRQREHADHAAPDRAGPGRARHAGRLDPGLAPWRPGAGRLRVRPDRRRASWTPWPSRS